MPLGIEQVVRGMLHRSRRGLYGGRTRLSGNQISEDGKNKCAPCLLIQSACAPLVNSSNTSHSWHVAGQDASGSLTCRESTYGARH